MDTVTIAVALFALASFACGIGVGRLLERDRWRRCADDSATRGAGSVVRVGHRWYAVTRIDRPQE